MSDDEFHKVDWKEKLKHVGPKLDEKMMSDIQLNFARKIITVFTGSIIFTVIYAGTNVYIDYSEDYDDDYWIR